MEIKIVIPSHKRADRVLTQQIVADPIICIPESQREAYQRHNPETELVTHPDNVVGLTAKRQWIYTHFGDVFMLDDDVVELRRTYVPSGEKPAVNNKLHVRQIIEATAYAAKQTDAYLFGFAKDPNPVTYKSLVPIALSGYVTGCATGLLRGSKLYYDLNIKANEDYWISALNAHYHRLIYKDTRFAFIQKDTFISAGGLAEFRNLAAEEEDFHYLRAKFGEAIQSKAPGKLRKRKHAFEKTLVLPF